MMTRSAAVGFKIAKAKQQAIAIEYRNAVLTLKDRQKLEQLKQTLQKLYRTYDVDRED
ncbi:hypothetical protein IQ255_15700 [Pleurocapsales cyanobacterium LEGE 10410]|nr:hypothetical protein [Pleurocapsales cyanobacterium LEGE 10410]